MIAVVPLLAAAAPTTSQILHVRASATGANDGTSWSDAYTDLVLALSLANAGDEVWVAAGTYRPSATGDRSATFRVPDGIALYGGFAGTEVTLAERAGLFGRTVLSGDLLGDDGPGFLNVADNSLHVVSTGFFAAALDGFTISGGNATDSDGGGMTVPLFGLLSISNCIFRANRADRDGGALYMPTCEDARIGNCLFLGNHADQAGGAARMYPLDSEPRFESCRFVGNTAGAGGGAIAIAWADFVNCEFSGNSADGSGTGGGAMSGHQFLLENCTLSRNTARGSERGGGGILATGSVFLGSSILWGNADDEGTGESSQLRQSHPDWLEVRSSCVEGWTGRWGTAHDVLFGDPRFRDDDGQDGVAGTVDDDLQLDLGSPCVDAAEDPSTYFPLPSTDVGGRRRYRDSLACDAGGVLDVGANERAEIDGTTNHCGQPPTSLGFPATIDAPCVVSIASGNLPLVVGPVSSHVGFFFCGSESASTPFGGDQLCVAGETHRLPAPERRGRFLVLDLDLADPRARSLVAGSTWNVQALFRDAGTLRLSDAVTITFRE